jgi:copper resistance protein D
MMEADWPLIAVRFALYATLSGLFGLSAFGLYSLRADERGKAMALRPWLLASGLLGLLMSVVALSLLAAAMAGVPPWPIDGEAVGMLLTGTATGTAWEVRIGALAVATVAALAVPRSALPLPMVAFSSAVALATLAWTGHGAMDEGAMGWVHLLADIAHLLAAGVWIGALLGLLLLVTRPAHRTDEAHLILTHRALHGFGIVGTIVVGTIVASGMVNGWLLIGPDNLLSLGTTLYGQLLLVKLALFVVMLGLASLNRFRLTPFFQRAISTGDHRGALAILRRSLVLEAACAIVIVALVAWLGTLEPPASSV